MPDHSDNQYGNHYTYKVCHPAFQSSQMPNLSSYALVRPQIFFYCITTIIYIL